MKVNLKNQILDFEGRPVLGQNQKPFTFGSLIRTVLTNPKEKESADDKLKRFQLGLRCVADEVDLTLDERAMIKKLVSEFDYSPLVYGRIHEAFEDGEEAKPKKKKDS